MPNRDPVGGNRSGWPLKEREIFHKVNAQYYFSPYTWTVASGLTVVPGVLSGYWRLVPEDVSAARASGQWGVLIAFGGLIAVSVLISFGVLVVRRVA